MPDYRDGRDKPGHDRVGNWHEFGPVALTVVEQRIFFGKAHESCDAVLGCRVRASALRKGEVFHARSTQQPRQAIVSFDAARLVIDSAVLIALLREFLPDGPR